MPRGKIKDNFWWDDKTSSGKTSMQIVKAIGKELLFNKNEIEMILTKFASLKEDHKFFKKGIGMEFFLLVCIYLCTSTWLLGKEPLNPRKFIKICKKNRIGYSYSSLTKYVREAKKAGFFRTGPRCEKIIAKYRNRIIYKFSLDVKTLDEIQELEKTERMNTAGKNPFVVAAGFCYLIIRKKGLLVSQKQLADFFGVSELSVRNFWTPYRNEIRFGQ